MFDTDDMSDRKVLLVVVLAFFFVFSQLVVAVVNQRQAWQLAAKRGMWWEGKEGGARGFIITVTRVSDMIGGCGNWNGEGVKEGRTSLLLARQSFPTSAQIFQRHFLRTASTYTTTWYILDFVPGNRLRAGTHNDD